MVVPFVQPYQDPEETKILQLDDQMSNILRNKKLPLEAKITLYTQTLTKFLRIYKQPPIPDVIPKTQQEDYDDESMYHTTIEPNPKSEPNEDEPEYKPELDKQSEPEQTQQTQPEQNQPQQTRPEQNEPEQTEQTEQDPFVKDMLSALEESVQMRKEYEKVKKSSKKSSKTSDKLNVSSIPNQNRKLNITDHDISVLQEIIKPSTIWEQPKQIFTTETFAPPAPYISRTRTYTVLPSDLQRQLNYSTDRIDNYVTRRRPIKEKKIPKPPPLSESIFKTAQPVFKVKTKRKNATIKSSARLVQESIRMKELYRPTQYTSNKPPMWEDLHSLYGSRR